MNADDYVRKTRIIEVADGKTLRLLIDLGFRTFTEHSIRLFGVICEDLNKGTDEQRAQARESRGFVVRWLEQHQRESESKNYWPFYVRGYKTRSFGRFMGTVYCVNGHNLNDDIIRNGFGREFGKEEPDDARTDSVE